MLKKFSSFLRGPRVPIMLVAFPLWTVIEIAWMMCLVLFLLPDFSCIFLPISLLYHKILNCQIHFQNQWFWPKSLIVKDRSLDSEQWFHWNFRVAYLLCQKTKTNVNLLKCFLGKHKRVSTLTQGTWPLDKLMKLLFYWWKQRSQ